MTNPDTPKDGDFAAYLESKVLASDRHRNATAGTSAASQTPPDSTPAQDERRQTIADILVAGEEPTDEFLEEFNALENAPPWSDEELARLALEHPGEDGDPHTPE